MGNGISKLLLALLVLGVTHTSEAQLWKKIKQKASEKVEEQVDRKIDDVLEGEKKPQKKKDTEKDTDKERSDSDRPENAKTETGTTKNEVEVWRNYKFVPGEKVVFYDDLKREEVGEFPSRWDLVSGSAEVVRLNDDNTIMGLATYNNRVTPLFEKSGYLSDEFTIEFDVFIDDLSRENNNSWAYYNLYFGEDNYREPNEYPNVNLAFRSGKTEGHVGDYTFPLEEVSLGELNGWHHISLSYYKGKFKLYYDEKRIANLPKINVVPKAFAIDFEGHASAGLDDVKIAIKNIRIAHGGGEMYKRIVSDGSYVTNGILFDSGKATLKKESLGVLNKLTSLMKDNSDWNFLVVGHTDADGDEADNMKLSKARAAAVKAQMIQNGVAAERITTEGKGEGELLNGNTTPEEKATNRRVEFILKK
ncbi:OmpA family protein [Maribacter sp. 2-571]|uniref:OmpA family protein n=1 Tax=Maribacter sp. 2-571 TaxID=3417569 RepID=UPI003D335299